MTAASIVSGNHGERVICHNNKENIENRNKPKELSKINSYTLMHGILSLW